MKYLEYLEISCHLDKVKNDYYSDNQKLEKIRSEAIKVVSSLKEVVTFSTNNKNNKNDTYAYLVPIYEDRIKVYKNQMSELEFKLVKTRQQLFESKNIYDIVFKKRFLEFENVRNICRDINYTKSSVYRFINEIKLSRKTIKEKYTKM